ncbi:hypothetical protein JGY90_10040 [Staphylococcus xylosus]|uniref:hypothetical protein n=1 Tax=Staphylococcus TaxID=1279 RepID=UPI000349F0FF|nr:MULTISPECIES: hypothetical protein [Staphylococcus]RIL24744.1 hypothetical protein BUY99_01610 [Staphylococcus gallinarum]RIO85687.1 hypothetical protein BUZ10_04800 [Staphylococcus gallinarum]UBV34044.1 hypothetical protein JGY90_10040 [Staphylococcus xylosus]
MFTLFIVIVIFAAIVFAIGRLFVYITYRSGGILDGAGVLFLGSLRAIQFVIGFGLLTGIIGSIPFLSFFWFIPFLITIYHLIFAFPLIFGPIMAMVSGFAGSEIINMLPEFMLKYYNKYTGFNTYTIMQYRNRESDIKPDIFLLHEAWENEQFLEDIEKWSEGEIERKPHFEDYYQRSE